MTVEVDSTGPRDNRLVIWVIAAIALFSCGLLVHALSNAASEAAALANRGETISPRKLISTLSVLDFCLMALVAGGTLALAIWEWRARALSLLLQTLSPGQAFVLLSIIVAWCGQGYLYPGLLLGGDTGSHIARFLEMRRGFDGGSLAQWTNYDYLGSPLLGFTGPFTYVVGGMLDVLVRDPVVTAKALLFMTHLAAGWIFYALLQRLDFKRVPALVAAVAFSCSFALLHLFLYRGVFPQQFTILFLVLTFFAAEGLMRGLPGLARDWVIFALSTAGLIVNHQPHALFVAFYLALFGVASIALGRWHIGKWPLLASAGAVGIAISAFAVLPIVSEANWVMIDPAGGFMQLQLPNIQRLSQLLLWRDTVSNAGTDYWAYVGLACIALALLGGWASISHRLGDERRKLALALLPGTIVMFFAHNHVVRDVMFIVFFASIFAALGMEQIVAISRPASRLALVCLLAVSLDVGSTSVQPIARRDKQYLVDAGRYLEASASNQRLLELDLDRKGLFQVNIGPSAGGMSYYSTVERVGGVHNMAATRIHNYAETIAKLAESDLRRDRRLTAATKTLLGLLDVSRIVCFGPAQMGCPGDFVGTVLEPPLGAVVQIPDATPAIFSQTLRTLSPPPGLDKPAVWEPQFDEPDVQVAAIQAFLERYVQTAGLKAHSHYASALPVRQLLSAVANPAPVVSTAWFAHVTSYSVGLQRVSITIASNGQGYAQLSHPWYPATDVQINGRQVQPIEGALDFMVVPLSAGLNVIELRPVATPIRIYSALMSGLALVLMLIMASFLHTRSRKSTAPKDGLYRT